jgi:hypothetical protein
MWLDSVECNVVRYWLKSSPSFKFVCNKEGKIAWCNLEFCNWLGVSAQEILNKNIEDFIMPNSSDNKYSIFDDIYIKDLNTIGFSYKLHRRMSPFNKSSRWGSLYITKHPPIGDIEFFLCTWFPVDYDNSELLQSTLVSMDKLSKKVESLTDQIKELCSIEDEATWASSTIKMIKKYPKISLLILVLILGAFGINNVLDIILKITTAIPTTP